MKNKLLKNLIFFSLPLIFLGNILAVNAAGTINTASFNSCLQGCNSPSVDKAQCADLCYSAELTLCITSGGSNTDCRGQLDNIVNNTNISPSTDQSTQSPGQNFPTGNNDPTPGGLPTDNSNTNTTPNNNGPNPFEEGIDDPEAAPTTSSFDVSKYLKIEGGQSYLENVSENKDKPSLGNALVFFIIETIELLTKIIGSFALLMVIVGGIMMMVSSGSSNLQDKSKAIIKYALLGLVVAFLSLIVVTFVQSLFFTA